MLANSVFSDACIFFAQDGIVTLFATAESFVLARSVSFWTLSSMYGFDHKLVNEEMECRHSFLASITSATRKV